MINFMLLVSRQGKTRLTKWYESYSTKEKARIVREVTARTGAGGPRARRAAPRGAAAPRRPSPRQATLSSRASSRRLEEGPSICAQMDGMMDGQEEGNGKGGRK
ncbi:hypothetical protein JL720_3958 [Aureococcus anophagefferens]|nr:hypothetical protein JL720_3958 [Aureococcus anophagefferens]